MEIRHLRYFATLAETCHFGQAADRLHVAQPALSYAIRQLEVELDASLFNRTTRKVSLTAAGEFLRGEAARILGGVDGAVRGVRRVADGCHGLIRLGLTTTTTFSHLPGIARAVRSQLPGITLEIHPHLTTAAQCEALRAGTLDVGLLRLPVAGSGLALQTIGVESLVLAVSAEHRLAAEPLVPVSELRNEVVVADDRPESAINATVLTACAQAGFVPHRDYLAGGTAALLALVAAGFGVAVVPESARHLPVDGVVFCDLLDVGTTAVALARRSGEHNPAVTAVVDAVESTFGLLTAGGLR